MKKIDKIIILVFVFAIVGIAIFIKLNKNSDYTNKYAEIYVKGDLYKKVDLGNGNKDKIIIRTNLGENIIDVHDGGVEIMDSDCRDEICVKDGFKDKPGEVLVCLPHKVMVKIVGENRADVDDVSY